ncbi:MAG: hypothetical protein QOH92_555 [Chloroflexota bacterium]|jgi:hypothetical protein|nr:hypothetical protein [Chloroflexota bacterium]
MRYKAAAFLATALAIVIPCMQLGSLQSAAAASNPAASSKPTPDIFQAATASHGGRLLAAGVKPNAAAKKEVVAYRSRNSRTFVAGGNYDIQWHFGNGWNLNAGCDLRIDLDDHDGVAYWAPDGYEVLFRSNGSGGYITPPGINADLVKNGDGTFTLTFHGSNLKYNFQTGGCLQNEVDRNGNTISMSYNGSLQTITDTEHRATTFTYNSSFSSDFITKITNSASRTYQYAYDTNRHCCSHLCSAGP